MRISDIEIERTVLGQLMAFEEHRAKVLTLEVEDFHFDTHQKICAAMLGLFAENGDYDYLTVANVCGEDIREEITLCIKLAISSGLFDEYYRLLKDMASRRRLSQAIDRLSRSGDVSVASLQKIIDNENGKNINNSAAESTEKSLEAFVENLNKTEGVIYTGFSGIDKTLGGIRYGTVFIIGARPSVGKTAFALNIAANQINSGNKVMFFSLEMTAEMIYERVMAARLGIEYDSFVRNRLTDAEIKKISEEAQRLKQDQSFLVLDEVYNVELICNMIRENRPSLAVIDFMQIISASGKFENVRNRIDYISSLLKRTAKDTGCVILVLSQLSRVGKDQPSMSDLKESGGLEQDGDVIALLHRPYVLNKGDPSIAPEQTELMIDKNKFGRVGKVNMHFDLKHQAFYELDEWHSCRDDRTGSPFDEVEL